MSVLTPEHRAAFDRDGYVVVEGLVPAARCYDLVAEVWSLLRRRGVEEHDPGTWAAWPEGRAGTGFLNVFPIFHLRAGWENRQDPRVHECFSGLLGLRELAVSLDRVNFKRPTRLGDAVLEGWLGRGFVHHDLNLWHSPPRLQVQGLIALTPAAGDEAGGFWCVPGFHREAAAWAASHPERAAPADQTLVDFLSPEECGDRLRPVPLSPGDLLVWNSLLPHGNSPNRSGELRACQYLRMFPAADLDAETRTDRLRSYETGHPPGRFSTGSRVTAASADAPASPYTPPPLTPLGRRLLGADPW